MAEEERKLEVVNVTLDAKAVWGGGEEVLAALVEDLGPVTHPRLIFLPPLVANLMACGEATQGQSLNSAVRESARGRWGRRLSVRFAYPNASGTRRPWLVQHDRVHQTLRGHLANLARVTGSCLLAGTAVLDHPRTHWENWPDTGHLFHTAWCFRSDTEPHDVLRHKVPGWGALSEGGVDPSLNEGRTAITTPMGPVGVLWDDTAYANPPAGPVVWAPRAWSAQEAADDRSPAAQASSLLGDGASIAVRTCLVGALGTGLEGESFIASRREDGVVATQVAPWPADGLSWCRATLPWPWPTESGAADSEPAEP